MLSLRRKWTRVFMVLACASMLAVYYYLTDYADSAQEYRSMRSDSAPAFQNSSLVSQNSTASTFQNESSHLPTIGSTLSFQASTTVVVNPSSDYKSLTVNVPLETGLLSTTLVAGFSDLIHSTDTASLITEHFGDTASLITEHFGDTASLITEHFADTAPLINEHSADTVSLMTEHSTDTVSLITEHSADTVSLITEHSADTVSLITEHSADTVSLITEHSTDTASLITEHSTDTVSLITEHSADTVSLMTEHSTDTVSLMTEHSADTVLLITEHSTDTVLLITEHSTDTVLLITEHSTDTVSLITEHSTDTVSLITEHSTDTVSLITEHSTDTVSLITGQFIEITHTIIEVSTEITTPITESLTLSLEPPNLSSLWSSSSSQTPITATVTDASTLPFSDVAATLISPQYSDSTITTPNLPSPQSTWSTKTTSSFETETSFLLSTQKITATTTVTSIVTTSSGRPTLPEKSKSAGDTGLSTGGKVAIGILVPVAVIGLIIFGVYFYRRYNAHNISLKNFLQSSVRYRTYTNDTYADDEELPIVQG